MIKDSYFKTGVLSNVYTFIVISINMFMLVIQSFNIKLGQQFLVNQFEVTNSGLPVSTPARVKDLQFGFELVNQKSIHETGKPEIDT